MNPFRPYSRDPDRPAALGPRSTTVTNEIHCRRCGYLLCGLDIRGNCPECNAKVEMSLIGNFLEFAERRWLLRVHLGARLLFWTFMLYIASGAAMFLYFLLFIFLRSSLPWEPSVDLLQLLILFVQALGTVGAIFVTDRDAGALWQRDSKARLAARWTAIVALVISIGLFSCSFYLHSYDRMIVPLAFLANAALRLSSVIFQLRWIAQLAERIPDSFMQERARLLARGLSLSGGAVIMLMVFVIHDSPSAGGLLCVCVFPLVATIALVIAHLFLLRELGLVMRAAALRSLEFQP